MKITFVYSGDALSQRRVYHHSATSLPEVPSVINLCMYMYFLVHTCYLYYYITWI